jgi:hypothetical protein
MYSIAFTDRPPVLPFISEAEEQRLKRFMKKT